MSQRPGGLTTYLSGIIQAANVSATHADAALESVARARSLLARAQSDRDQVHRNLEHVRSELRYVADVLAHAERWYTTLRNNNSTQEQINEAADAMFHSIHRWLGDDMS